MWSRSPGLGRGAEDELTVAELVRNGTMSADIAGVLWAAVDEGVSFLTVALPQNAGKSTTAKAVLALRPPEVPLHHVGGEPALMERLKRERLGGYLVVDEFSRGPVPGYIWGEPVRRVFDTLDAGYSLQSSLHAESAEAAIRQITEGNGISDEQAATIGLVLYIEMFGASFASVTRRLVDVYEVYTIEDGGPVGESLFRWRRDGDRFEKMSEPRAFGRDRDDLDRRAAVIARLASSGRTAPADIAGAVAVFRRERKALSDS